VPLLKIQQLIKRYAVPGGGVHTVLDVPKFTLDAGQQVALRGASGTGKTTFLNCIAGILRPDQGDIELAGQNIAVASEGQRDQLRAQHIGYIFQTFNHVAGLHVPGKRPIGHELFRAGQHSAPLRLT
jgi:putative ABC transport system ATP-binding protein